MSHHIPGAPVSLAQLAIRTAAQEEKVLHVRQLQRQARALVKQLEADREVNRHSLIMGRAFLRIGCMLLTHAITNDDEAL